MLSREYLNFLNVKNAGFWHSGRMFALLQIKFENLFTIWWYVVCYLHFVYRLFTSNSVILKSFQSFNFKPQDFPLKLSRKTEANLKFAGKPAEKIPSFCCKNKCSRENFLKNELRNRSINEFD